MIGWITRVPCVWRPVWYEISRQGSIVFKVFSYFLGLTFVRFELTVVLCGETRPGSNLIILIFWGFLHSQKRFIDCISGINLVVQEL